MIEGMRAFVMPAHAESAWMARAACHGHTELFFGPPRELPEVRVAREMRARALCAACPVQEPCRTWARTYREHGLWGGESEEQRTKAGYRPKVPSRGHRGDQGEQDDREDAVA